MPKISSKEQLLLLLFLCSGFAALSYQISWQRILFFSFGTDIESTTIVVAIFMFGLGIGALAGGIIADLVPKKIILIFSLIEFGIGIFGFFSPTILMLFANHFSSSSYFVVAVVSFGILLIPTSLMGATLPMLVTHFYKTYKNIGVSTGQLYSINTFGSALGCYVIGFIAFNYLDLRQVIQIAAFINIAVGAACFSIFLKDRK